MGIDQNITFSALDPSQKNAFNSINNDPSTIQIVYGPPGTGKSQLIVSLLERLASENKKVLFISQNTEALRVIERFIRRTEEQIGYPTDNKYISLLDFCLMLHNPTHRYLKYLREQYSKLSGKQLPAPMSIEIPLRTSYQLQYTNLDHNKNYKINNDSIGFDELASYYLKYVHRSMAPESIREFENVNVRTVFNALDNYKHREYFKEFNKPRRELILLSTKNSNIVLPDIREQVKNIQSAFIGDWIAAFPAKLSIDVVDYLKLIELYQGAIKYIDIYRISTEKKDITQLTQNLKTFIDNVSNLNDEIIRIDKYVDTVQNTTKNLVKLSDNNLTPVKINDKAADVAEKDFGILLDDLNSIKNLLKETVNFAPDIQYGSLRDLYIGLAHEFKNHYAKNIEGGTETLGKLTAENIDILNKDLEKYYSQNTIKRTINGIPKSFKNLLAFNSPKQIDLYRNEFKVIVDAFQDVIRINDVDINNILKIGNIDSSIDISKLGVKKAKDIDSLKRSFLTTYKLVNLLLRYDILSKDGDFSTIVNSFNDLANNIKLLNTLIQNPSNKKAFIGVKLKDFIDDINKSVDIEIQKIKKFDIESTLKETIQSEFSNNAKWFIDIKESSEYLKKVNEIQKYLDINEKQIQKIIDCIDLPSNNRAIDQDIDSASTLVNRVNLLDIFSDFFYELSDKQTIQDWLNSIKSLENYNNVSEIVEFIEHNKIIDSIRNALGDINSRYLDMVIENDIDFDIFASRIVNVLVGESFGRASLKDKKHINTSDIVTDYDKYIRGSKVRMYRETLKHIYSESLSSLKDLSKQSTMQLGGKSTMDKFRHNTNTIASAFPIICATPKEVSKYIAADKGLFDYVIFDEASQLLPGQAIPSIYRAKKAVIIGDPHQMPPSLNASFGTIEQSEDDFDDLGESILDLVRKQPLKQHHLKVHYRSKYNKLFEPSREAIYSNDGIEPIFEAELANGAPIDIVDDLGEGIDEYGYDKNFHKICTSIDEYLSQNSQSSFCILFTTGQKLTEFKNFLAEIGERQYSDISKLYGTDKILVSTVTNCQGIEGTYTIIYMQHYASPGAMWFFRESTGAYKRLNVSITRQREGLKLLLADQRSHWIQTCENKINNQSTGPNTLKSADLMRALLRNAGEVADTTYLDRKLGDNVNFFDSPLTEQLYNRLVDHYEEQLGYSLKIYSEVGWNLLIPTGEGIDANERNVGFRIDLGIFSTKHKKFVLGIEMDGAMYHSGFDKEQSDYNRQKVLEEKGWKLYRIWSTNWLDDPEREFNKLVECIDAKLL